MCLDGLEAPMFSSPSFGKKLKRENSHMFIFIIDSQGQAIAKRLINNACYYQWVCMSGKDRFTNNGLISTV